MVKILIIIPCYNEANTLPLILEQLLQLKLPAHYKMEIAVVNDCSKDDTKWVAGLYPIVLLDLLVNLGIGGAVQTGFLYAKEHGFDIAVQIDGDGQHPPWELIKLIEFSENTRANIVIGSRFLNEGGFKSSFARRLGIRYFHWLNKLLTGKNIYDSTSGFRLFDKAGIAIAAEKYPDEFPEPASLVLFAKAGLTIKEVPVVMSERLAGKSSIRNFVSIYYCIKVTISMLFLYIRNLINMNRIQAITIVLNFLFIAYISRLIIKGKLREEYAIVWCLCTFVLILFSLWPKGLSLMSKLFGVFDPPNLVFTTFIFLILIYLLHLSVVSSKAQHSITRLTQEFALLKEKMKKEEKENIN